MALRCCYEQLAQLIKQYVLIGAISLISPAYSQDIQSLAHLISSGNSESINNIKLDNNNNSVVSGVLNDSLQNQVLNFACDCNYLAKFDVNGDLMWIYDMAIGNNPPAIAIDDNNNIFATAIYGGMPFTVDGYTFPDDSSAIFNIALMKFDPAGNLLWGEQITKNAQIKDLVIDKNGDLVITGYTTGISPFSGDTIISYGGGNYPDLLLAKFDSLGNFIWATHAGNPGFNSDSGNALATDNNNNIFVGGEIRGDSYFDSILIVPTSTFVFSPILAKYDPYGNAIWVKLLSTGGRCITTATDSSGNCYFGGYGLDDLANWTIPFETTKNMYIAKVDPGGDLIWAVNNEVDNTGNPYLSSTYDISVDQDRVYAAGYFTDSLVTGNNIALDGSMCVLTPRNVFLIGLDTTGNDAWGLNMRSCNVVSLGYSMDYNGCRFGLSGAIVQSGNEYVYWENDSIGNMLLWDGFMMTIGNPDCIAVGLENLDNEKFLLYPNPTNGELTIDLGNSCQSVKVKQINLLGQLVKEETFKSIESIQTYVEGAPGVYQFEIYVDDERKVTLSVLKE